MSDLISRQAAIDAIDKRFDDVPMELTTEILQLRRDLRERIPSAQPATSCSEIPNGSDDTISRQAAVEVCTDRFGICVKKEALEALPAVQPEPHWIPCSERLPEEGQKCLVCDKGGIGIDTYIDHGNPYNWKWYTRDYEAWQPLPEPYRGGDSE